jgi:hypothetical protein
MVKEGETEDLGKHEQKAKEANEIQQCSNDAVQEYVVEVFIHQLEVDVLSCSHNDNREDNLKEEVVTAVEADLSRPELINLRSEKPHRLSIREW